MRYIALGALLGLLLILCPGLLVALAANPLVITFALGFALRPAITRRFHGWAT